MADRVWSEKDLVRRANRRLAVLQHAEEVSRKTSGSSMLAQNVWVIELRDGNFVPAQIYGDTAAGVQTAG
jgi:hypothetical protein